MTGCHGCLPLGNRARHDDTAREVVQTPDAYYVILIDQSLNI